MDVARSGHLTISCCSCRLWNAGAGGFEYDFYFPSFDWDDASFLTFIFFIVGFKHQALWLAKKILKRKNIHLSRLEMPTGGPAVSTQWTTLLQSLLSTETQEVKVVILKGCVQDGMIG